LLSGVLVVAGCSKEAPPQQQRPAPQVTVVTVKPQTIPSVPSFVAQTESSQQVDIVARVSGYLDRIAYQEGDLVREGQLLFQLDPRPFKAQLDAARGELQAQQARHTTAAATLNRVKPLAEQKALPQSELDRAQGEFDGSKAAVFSAQAKVTEAELNLGYTTIRSPVTGLASRSTQRQGAYINSLSADAKLTYVARIEPIWVNFSVSQNQLAKRQDLVKRGLLALPQGENYEIEVVMPNGDVYPHRGKINFASPSFSQDTGSFLVRAVLPNPKRELRPGMFVTANLHGTTRPDAIVVPQLAVQQGANGHLVYVIRQDGTAEVRPVIVGDYYGEKQIVIEHGLRAADRVVVDGVLKVVPGQPVQIVEAGVGDGKGKPPAESGGKGEGGAAPASKPEGKGKSSQAPAAPLAGNDGRVLPAQVRFAWRSSALDGKGRQVIASVAATLKYTPDRIRVTGYADARGTPQRNHKFAAARARAVRDALAAAGVDASRIELVKPERVVGDGSAEEARRVDILPAGHAG
jgi:membrane fusion protein (multidrug efflux system)